ncbi:MAG: hypothetical protein JWQ49_1872 [Edaphobacter sp.]|nr:hypothetical protein [Edaphobacter sp.]
MNVPSAFKLSAIGFTGLLVLLTFSKHVIPKVQAHESEGCSIAALNGAYGLVLKGEVFNVGPIVAVGVSTRTNQLNSPQEPIPITTINEMAISH